MILTAHQSLRLLRHIGAALPTRIGTGLAFTGDAVLEWQLPNDLGTLWAHVYAGEVRSANMRPGWLAPELETSICARELWLNLGDAA